MFIFKNTLDYYTDPFIQELIEKYLLKTISAETMSKTFEVLINESFISLDTDTFINAFKSSNKDEIQDDKWREATTSVIDAREYTTYSNVGGKYYNLICIDFINQNKVILVNDFVKKFCKEKEIRDSLLNQILSAPQLLTVNVGDILGTAYREELKMREEDKLNATVAFEVYSKEIIEYELPQLTDGKIYAFKNDAGAGVGNIIENKLEFRPPTVMEETNLYAELITLNGDGVVETRNGFNITVKPPKYLRPTFKTYRLKPDSTLQIALETVEENYKYYVSVPKGFGTVTVEDYMLSYTAPVTSLAQNVAVRLVLTWNDKTIVYDTIINFNIVVDSEDVDSSDSSNAFMELKEKVASNAAEIENIKAQSDLSTVIIDGNIFETLD